MKKKILGLLFFLTASQVFAGLEEAKSFYTAGNYEQAVEQLNLILTDSPSNMEALKILTDIYKKTDLKKYITTAKNYLKSGGKLGFDDIWNLANMSYENFKDLDSALYFTSKCNQIAPNRAEVYNLIGVLYYHKENLKLSIIALKTSVYLSGSSALYASNLARSYEKIQNFKKASAYYKMSVKNDPNFTRSVNALKRLEGN
ncbi:MAG TPA: hypothetical protein DHW82_02170 [Spirochaetia bacterium]|nr:MAG: hypothetical protein A2Y41_07090 [Spirochaetes bacterium GWB1_36_13]HCL55801.1 hypothetical protein [Spirochaetia bacterium]